MLPVGSMVFDSSSLFLVAGFSDNIPPILFLALIGVCAIMIVAGAVVDMMPERAASDRKVSADSADAAAKKLAKAEQLKAKMEAKARQKAEKAAAKAAKGKQGKSKAPAPATETVDAPQSSDEFEPSESSPIESIDFSEPE